jgi:hypothetical protein
VQFFDDAGERNEAVGFLERTELVEGRPVLHIRKKDDTLVAVPFHRIKAGRVVPTR